jgi:hypothetical protein
MLIGRFLLKRERRQDTRAAAQRQAGKKKMERRKTRHRGHRDHRGEKAKGGNPPKSR